MAKFQDEVARALYNRSIEEGLEDQAGCVDEGGWAGLVKAPLVEGDGRVGAIIQQDEDGFVSAELFDDEDELTKAWEEVVDDLEDGDDDDDDDETSSLAD